MVHLRESICRLGGREPVSKGRDDVTKETGENTAHVEKALGSQNEAWEKWATGRELVGIAALATLGAVREEQPFGGPGPEKKGHKAGRRTETCPSCKHPLTPEHMPIPQPDFSIAVEISRLKT